MVVHEPETKIEELIKINGQIKTLYIYIYDEIKDKNKKTQDFMVDGCTNNVIDIFLDWLNENYIIQNKEE